MQGCGRYLGLFLCFRAIGRFRVMPGAAGGEEPFMIEVQHLTKRYGPFTAVDDVSFRVEKGEIFGFLGPNGAGKTTTMRVLTGYMPATEGKAIVAGHDVFEDPIAAKSKTGYLPETPPLYPEMTVREYLTFCAKMRLTRMAKAERVQRVD